MTSAQKGQFVYSFGEGRADGGRDQRDLLGGKGANLAEMTSLGLPVPPGFTLSTQVCVHYYKNNEKYPEALSKQVDAALAKVESQLGAQFGSSKNPLLVSVRSGARVSMPGMMDTILNLGLNDQTVLGLAQQSGDERFAFDSFRRFLQMYGDVVLGILPHKFETLIIQQKARRRLKTDAELNTDELKDLVANFKAIIREETGNDFPQDPREQLWGAVGAVIKSWNSSRAISYRRIHKLEGDWGTAVNIQAMVFGNMGEQSATGVAFTRDPSTGEKKFFGEFLQNAQGEDVVAGTRTPHPINKESALSENRANGKTTMEELFADVYQELVQCYQKLEKHYRDMQDIEFTVQKGKLYLLQTRAGKRTASAAVRIAVEMVREKLITPKEAIQRISPEQVEHLLHPRLDPSAPREVIAKGLPASPGAACGKVVFSSLEAEQAKKRGERVVLVRHETSPEDIAGMDASEGVLTVLGGMTSHAAVVARGMGKPCVAGCGSISIDYKNQKLLVGDISVQLGDLLTIDGASGEVILGEVPTINSQVDDYFVELMKWVDDERVLEVRTNAETAHDVRTARQFGAEGVGLCRTEHMFFGDQRILAMREMILADSHDGRKTALEKLFPFQKSDFIEIFQEMEGCPVTVRLLDPPLHEFLPHSEDEVASVAHALGISPPQVLKKVRGLKEFNPMLGHRGCRLAVSYPEIYQMQARAIMEATAELVSGKDFKMEPEIMIPFVAGVKELALLKKLVIQECERVNQERNLSLVFRVGTMIEIPRAALMADEIAGEAEFFSFGTNDLTQMTMGLSRDDSGSFLPDYLEHQLYPEDPFVSLDRKGVGQLVQIGVERGRKTNPNLKIGICGEHGGDPKTVRFCHDLGLNYVSCSPFRVPVARLAAAQAAIGD